MSVPAIELLDPVQFGDFMQECLNKFGDTEDGMMTLLINITTMKAILEDALGLEKPLSATVEYEEDVDG